jgi:hypothetical protein
MLNLFFAVAVVALPKYFAVHIDMPRDRAALEDADRRDAAVRKAFYEAHKLDQPRVIMFSTADGTLYSLRARTSLSDFEKPSPLSDEQKKELSAKTVPISDDAHKSLLQHHNEIWEVDNDTTILADGHAPKYARLYVEQVKPPMFRQYDEAIKALHDAVAKTKGVSLIAFFSSYGDGAYRYLVLSDEPVDLFTLVSPAVRKQWRACVIDAKVVNATARPDLTLSDPAEWIPPAPHAP